jgi:hypothetical protein
VPAEEDAAAHSRLHDEDGTLEAGTIVLSAARSGWPERSRLPERQIAAEHAEAPVRQCGGDGNEEGRVAISARPVREDERVLAGAVAGAMEHSAHGRHGGSVDEIHHLGRHRARS